MTGAPVAKDFEDESSDAARKRRTKRVRRWLVEIAVALSFGVLLLGADHFSEAGAGSAPLAAVCVAGAIATLMAWFFIYVADYRGLDEFERAKELAALALAGGVTVFAAAAWGLAEAFLGAPDFPLAFIAPAFSAFYAIFRTLIALRYR
jgi:hypothetical protein